ncbi:transposase [Chromobacterium violaceum]|nr:transposase [Chromobacterium violaceum]
MKKSKFTEEQIAFALRQSKSGTAVAEVCRKVASPKPPSTTGKRNMTV